MRFQSEYCPEQEVKPEFLRYSNGNKALRFTALDGTPLVTASVNPGQPLPDDLLAVKDWSENEGVSDQLRQANIIFGPPVLSIKSGFVVIHCYLLTDEFKDKWPQR